MNMNGFDFEVISTVSLVRLIREATGCYMNESMVIAKAIKYGVNRGMALIPREHAVSDATGSTTTTT
jgi:hypothetical protein